VPRFCVYHKPYCIKTKALIELVLLAGFFDLFLVQEFSKNMSMSFWNIVPNCGW